ncbi:putative toxin-antitoxin system toxin component, PIN family, partial [Candidatus Woesearchaeota archaeon]|nr:putative toxin-antitoxin system toxin component, PIN family [Candidatus Woesearchaeota archaeon]
EQIVLISSIEIIEELVETLQEFKIQMPKEIIEKWRDTILRNAILVIPQERLKVVQNDPDDNKFFEAAVTGHADYIVSQDKHHLQISTFQGIKILKPEEFLRIRKEQEDLPHNQQ